LVSLPAGQKPQPQSKEGSVAGFPAKSMAQKALNWEGKTADFVIGPQLDSIFILTTVWYN
jgi:hypothetical protein